MKKLLTLVLALALAISCLALTACGGGVEGKYKCIGIIYDGVEYYLGDTIPGQGEVTQKDLDDMGIFELKAEGKGVIETQEFTYTVEGGIITITMGEYSSKFEQKDGKLYEVPEAEKPILMIYQKV